MKKHLEIVVDQIDWAKNEVKFHVSEQSHRNDKFGNCDWRGDKQDCFVASNNFLLVSIDNPEFANKVRNLDSDRREGLFVRGKKKDRDNKVIAVSLGIFNCILFAIQEYNAFEFPDIQHTIVIDGKTITISEESYKALKAALDKTSFIFA